MPKFDEVLAKTLVDNCTRYVDRALQPIQKRLSTMETQIASLAAREPVGVRSALQDAGGCLILTLSDGNVQNCGRVRGEDGTDAVLNEEKVNATIQVEVESKAAEIKAELEAEARSIAEAGVTAAREALIRLAEATGSKDACEITAAIEAEVQRQVALIPTPKDGNSITVEDVMPGIIKAVADQVTAAFATIPAPKDGEPGKSVTLEDVQPLIAAAVTDATKHVPSPESLADQIGVLVAAKVGEATIPTMDDVQPVIDQLRGQIMETLVQAIKEADDTVRAAIAAIPAPVNGTSVTLEDVQPILDEARDAMLAAVDKRVSEIRQELGADINTLFAALPKPKDGEPGKSVDLAELLGQVQPEVDAYLQGKLAELSAALPSSGDISLLVDDALKAAVAALPPAEKGEPGEPGTSVDANEVSKMISEAVKASITAKLEEAIAALPKPKDGEPGLPGKDADPEIVRAAVAEEFTRQVAALPPAQKGDPGEPGKAITLEEMVPSIIRLVDDAVGKIPPARGLKSLLIDHAGQLVATFSDGDIKEIGQVVGEDGTSVTPEMVRGLVEKAVAEIPRPRDALGFDDMTVEQIDERSFRLVFERGDVRKEFPLSFPVQVYKGAFRIEDTYNRGDVVTWGGCAWTCNADGTKGEKPKHEDSAVWTMTVKAGRDGRDRKVLPQPPATEVPLK